MPRLPRTAQAPKVIPREWADSRGIEEAHREVMWRRYGDVSARNLHQDGTAVLLLSKLGRNLDHGFEVLSVCLGDLGGGFLREQNRRLIPSDRGDRLESLD